jgi:hypothetical protein
MASRSSSLALCLPHPACSLQKIKLFIADDPSRWLSQLGYHAVNFAASGAQAIYQAETHRPDVVLTDILLQGDLDGVEAASAIRIRAPIHTVYLTAYMMDVATTARICPSGMAAHPSPTIRWSGRFEHRTHLGEAGLP